MKTCILLFITATLLSCNTKDDSMLIIGHRGAMGHETENTLASINKAIELGVDMIEIDVFKIRSGEIVVFHDERVERLTNGAGNVEEYYLLELKQLILDGGHAIPLLQEVLRLIDHRVPLNIELKGANTADRVNHIITYYVQNKGWALEDFLISSFNWEELRAMRAFNPEIAIAVLTEDNPVDAIPIADELKAVAINPNYKTLTSAKVQEIHQAGYKVYAYTVNEPEDIEKVKRLGVDGIFIDYPERAR